MERSIRSVTRRDTLKLAAAVAGAPVVSSSIISWISPDMAHASSENNMMGIEVVKPSQAIHFDESPKEITGSWGPIRPDVIIDAKDSGINCPIVVCKGKITERPVALDTVPQYIPGAETPFKTALVLNPQNNPRYLPLKQTYRIDKESEAHDCWTTYCNIFAKDMALNDGHPIPWAYGGSKMDAKAIDSWIKGDMAAELGWRGTNSIEIAMKMANKSKLVVVTFASYGNDSMDGHVAVLIPSKEKVPNMFEATIAQAGMLCGFMKLKDGFNGLINHRLYRADAANRFTFSWCDGEPYHFVRKA